MNIDLPAILPILFSDTEFINNHPEQFALYVELRVKGHHAHDVMGAAFGMSNADVQGVALRCAYLESTEQYRSMFADRLKVIPINDILNERMAIREYMAMYHNKYLKESVRKEALKEACVLAGITTIDDAGRTRKVPTMEDMYGDPKPGSEPTGEALH